MINITENFDDINNALFFLRNPIPKCEKPIKLKSGRLVGCGKCILCLTRKRKEWILRNKLELVNNPTGMFITLTFDAKHLQETSYYEVQKFLKRLRKYAQEEKKTNYIKYFGCYENGEKNGRPHYHILIFGYKIKPKINKAGICIRTADEELATIWNKGFCKVENLTQETISYTTKYITKEEENLFYDTEMKKLNKYNPIIIQRKPFIFMSKGIGFNRLRDIKTTILTKQYIADKGFKHNIPRSYIEKLKRNNDDELLKTDEDIINQHLFDYVEKYQVKDINNETLAEYIEFCYAQNKANATNLRRNKK